MTEQKSGEDLDRELIELLNELRVVLPGVQVLFAFLLAVPFANGWQRVTEAQKWSYMVALVATAIGSILLIAPSSYHRLRWREGDKEQMLRTSNRLSIAGTAFLALSMIAVVFVVTDVVFDIKVATGISIAVAALFAWFWYGLALTRAARD